MPTPVQQAAVLQELKRRKAKDPSAFSPRKRAIIDELDRRFQESLASTPSASSETGSATAAKISTEMPFSIPEAPIIPELQPTPAESTHPAIDAVLGEPESTMGEVFAEKLKTGVKRIPSMLGNISTLSRSMEAMTPAGLAKTVYERLTLGKDEFEKREKAKDKFALDMARSVERWAEQKLPSRPLRGRFTKPAENFLDYIDPKRIVSIAAENAPQMGVFIASSLANPYLGAAVMFGAEGGDVARSFAEMESEGVQIDPLVKRLAPVTVGAINAALEKTGLDAILKTAKAPGLKQKVTQWFISQLTESTTEGLQGVNSALAEAGAKGKIDKNLWDRFVEDAYAGLIIGMGASAGAGAAGTAFGEKEGVMPEARQRILSEISKDPQQRQKPVKPESDEEALARIGREYELRQAQAPELRQAQLPEQQPQAASPPVAEAQTAQTPLRETAAAEPTLRQAQRPAKPSKKPIVPKEKPQAATTPTAPPAPSAVSTEPTIARLQPEKEGKTPPSPQETVEKAPPPVLRQAQEPGEEKKPQAVEAKPITTTEAAKDASKVGGAASAEVANLPIGDIATDVDRFQNRATAFSEKTAATIAERYDPNKFDPIVVWRDPNNGKTYVLSGHSRMEGMKRRNERTIPARYFQGTEEQAMTFARLEANRLGTAENLSETLKAYESAKKQNYSKAKMTDLFDGDTGLLEDISTLDKKGDFVKMLGQSAASEFPYIRRFARWVGSMRKTYGTKMTDRHEQQLFDWLYKDAAKNREIGRDDFFALVDKQIQRLDWDPAQPLVLKRGEVPATGTRARGDTAKFEEQLAEHRRLRDAAITVAEREAHQKEIDRLEKDIAKVVQQQPDLFAQPAPPAQPRKAETPAQPEPKTATTAPAQAPEAAARPVEPKAAKEPWEMTREEFGDANDEERKLVARYGTNIDDDLKRNWSSWNFGANGFDGSRKELDDYLATATDTTPVNISGFELFPDDLKRSVFRELRPNYWVLVDLNRGEGLSGHVLESQSKAEALMEIKTKNLTGTGEGDTFDSSKARVIYSEKPRGEFGIHLLAIEDQALTTKHRASIKQAIREGKSVPTNVLADYPDLQKQAKKPSIFKSKATVKEDLTTEGGTTAAKEQTYSFTSTELEQEKPGTGERRVRYRTEGGQLEIDFTNYPKRPDANAETDKMARELDRELTKRGKYSLLAKGIRSELVERQTVTLIGKEIKSNDDLAVLGQVFRDPRYETFRYFFMSGNTCVGQIGFSSRLPGATASMPPNIENKWGWKTWIDDIMGKFGADGVYVMHNHPSGKSEPSSADIQTTGKFGKVLGNAFKGHVVIDSNNYSVMTTTAERGTDRIEVSVVTKKKHLGEEKFIVPQKDHVVLGRKIDDAEKLAAIGKAVVDAHDEWFVVIGLSRGVTRAVLDVNPSMFNDKARTKALLRRFARQTGSQDLFFVGDGKKLFRSKNFMQELANDNFITDAVSFDAYSVIDPIQTNAANLFGASDIMFGTHIDKVARQRGAGLILEEPKFEFENKDIETIWRASHGIPQESFVDRFTERLRTFKNRATREFEHLPKTAEFAQLRFDLLKLQKQKDVAADRALRTEMLLTNKLNKQSYDLFERKVILEDLRAEAEAGHNIPFFKDKTELEKELARVNEAIKSSPEVADSYGRRKAFWDKIKKDYTSAMEAIGFEVESRLTKENYFRHQVLEYATAKGARGIGKRLKTPAGRGFLKTRGGSTYAINTNYLQAEHEVIAKMLYDIEVAKTIKAVNDNHNIAPRLKKEAAAMRKETGDDVDWQELIPEGYALWQPREGNVLYMADSIAASLARKLQEEELESLEITKEDLRKVLAVGGKRNQFVVKEEVAETLNKLFSQPVESPLESFTGGTLTAWKAWQLTAPRRLIKYNLRNLSGDADAMFVGNPRGFAKLKQAAGELRQVFFGKSPMTKEMEEWFYRGGMQSNLQFQELPDIDKLAVFKNITTGKTLPQKIAGFYWQKARDITNFRESIMRYANYLSYLEQMQNSPDGMPKNFGASIPGEIKALPDIRDRAYKLSNELMGAYDEVSVVGQYVRKHIFPFWSWKETNFKRYIQFAKNAAADKKLAAAVGQKLVGTVARSPLIAARIGAFAISASALWAGLQVWNHLFFDDEENELPPDVQGRPHIIFGRDKNGKIMYFSRLGALGDFLEWFGLDAAPNLVDDWLNGKKSVKEIAVEMSKKPVNVVAQGIRPEIKQGAELASGKSFFPDVFKPTTIRDRGLYLARSVGLENEYIAMMGLPSRGYEESLPNLLLYKIDPRESAYFQMYDIKRRYLEKIGSWGEFGGQISPRSNALYNVKLAIRYGDKQAFEKYLLEYANLGGSEKGFEQSMRNLDPLSGISKDKQKDFLASLDNDEKATLERAQKFYKDVLLGTKREFRQEITKTLPKSSKKSIFKSKAKAVF